ncbi:MAG: MJ1255/VC2487 family glycosyltransferase [Parahaliea sp.]
MRILYGVQGTGQGHISRARAMARALAQQDVQVDWLFSGRRPDQFFDMQAFGQFQYRRGLTFTTKAGRVSYTGTALGNNIFHFLKDIYRLKLDQYDLIVSDFEPVSAWAGQLSDIPTIGIGHQYAFGKTTPIAGGNVLSRQIIRHFAPVSTALGLHWHPYADNVLPPILDLPQRTQSTGHHILVYLPFEDQQAVSHWLRAFPDYHFHQYAPGLSTTRVGNIWQHPPSIRLFKQDLARCRGVICNSGFELISECLQWHKPVLTKPLTGQMEQLSNALALAQLGYAHTIDRLCKTSLAQWLHTPKPAPQLHFADVAAALAQWLAEGCHRNLKHLQQQLWNASHFSTSIPVCTAKARSYPGIANQTVNSSTFGIHRQLR